MVVDLPVEFLVYAGRWDATLDMATLLTGVDVADNDNVDMSLILTMVAVTVSRVSNVIKTLCDKEHQSRGEMDEAYPIMRDLFELRYYVTWKAGSKRMKDLQILQLCVKRSGHKLVMEG